MVNTSGREQGREPEGLLLNRSTVLKKKKIEIGSIFNCRCSAQKPGGDTRIDDAGVRARAVLSAPHEETSAGNTAANNPRSTILRKIVNYRPWCVNQNVMDLNSKPSIESKFKYIMTAVEIRVMLEDAPFLEAP